MSGIKSIAPDTDTAQVAVTMAFALGFGVLAVFGSLWNNGTIWNGLLWAGAWSSVGWFLGFLFGIPRYLSTDTARTRSPMPPGPDSTSEEVESAIATAKKLRDVATAAANDKAAADANASQAAQVADQSARDSAEATAKSSADPQNTALKDDAEAKTKDFELARRSSDEANTLAATADETAQSTDAAAKEAEEAAEAAKSKLTTANAGDGEPAGSSLTVNTNLEQISDWLTKIIVGVSLVESQTLLIKMREVSTFMAKSMVKTSEHPSTASFAASSADAASAAAPSATTAVGGVESFSSMESFAYAVMLYFLATGLLGSYLLTRLFLQRAFDKAAHGATRAK